MFALYIQKLECTRRVLECTRRVWATSSTFPKTLIHTHPWHPTDFFESTQSCTSGLQLLQALSDRWTESPHLWAAGDWFLGQSAYPNRGKKERKAECMSHGSEQQCSSVFCSLLTATSSFLTRRLPELNAARIMGRACCAAPPERLVSAAADATCERARGLTRSFIWQLSKPSLQKTVSETKGSEVETQTALKVQLSSRCYILVTVIPHVSVSNMLHILHRRWQSTPVTFFKHT